MRRSLAALFVVGFTASAALGTGVAACTSSDDSGAPSASDAGGSGGTHADAALLTDGSGGGGPSPACVTNPTTYLDIINACTDAQAIDKTDDLSVMNLPDGGLRPLP
jgi:hypothetical protein